VAIDAVMGTRTAVGRPAATGWLRGAEFDGVLIFGVAALGLASGAAVVTWPGLFPLILTLDLWLLGYHHVISTFTRISFDAASFRQYRALVLWLPLGVVAGVIVLAAGVGVWTLPTIYLYWQWWHYTRQSYGVAQLYRRKGDGGSRGAMMAAIYLLPLAGILSRSAQDPGRFLGAELRVLPVPDVGVALALAVAGVGVGWWLWEQAGTIRRGDGAWAYRAYIVSHLAIFAVGYLLIRQIDHGWLVLNVWHNAQYILVVWMFNNTRFKDGVDARARLLSTLSQRRYLVFYFGVSLLISSAVYLSLQGALGLVAASSLPLALIVYQSINFHHYIVDSVIWKVRRPQIATNLGVSAGT